MPIIDRIRARYARWDARARAANLRRLQRDLERAGAVSAAVVVWSVADEVAAEGRGERPVVPPDYSVQIPRPRAGKRHARMDAGLGHARLERVRTP